MKKALITLLLSLAFGPAAFGQAASPNWDKLRPAVTLDATTDSALISGHGYGTVGFQIAGTWSGTIQFFGTINGTDWVGVTGFNAASRAGDSTATENGIYYVGTSGLRYVKAQFTTYTSGSAVVTAITTDDIAILTSGGSAAGGGGAASTVDVLSISAGNNNIGNVDIVTMPGVAGAAAHDAAASGNPLLTGAYASATAPTAVSADGDAVRLWADLNGRLQVGDGGGSLTVDASSLPLPTGAATAANQSTGNTSLGTIAGAVSGTEMQVDVVAALPAGNNNVGDVDVASIAAGNNNIGDVDVASVVPGTGATNSGKAEDAAHTTGDVGAMALAVRRDANTTLAGTDGDYAPLQVNADGSLKVAITAGAGSGGTSATDDAAFTPGSGSATPIAGFADETTPDAVDEGDVGAVRMTLSRALHVNLRDASGNELSVGSQYAEDAAHTTGDQVMMAGAVRRDTPASSSGTDGDISTLNVSSAGRLWTSTTVDAALPAGTNNIGDVDVLTLPGVAGTAAHDAAVSGNPVRVGARAQSADVTAVASGDAVDVVASLLGKLVTLPYALPGATWRYAAAAGGLVNTTGVTAKAAGGAGVRNYITGIQCVNSHQTTGTEVEVRDGAAGTVMFRGWAQAAGGGFAAKFEPPLRGTAATLVEIAEVTTTGTAGVVCNLQGYEAAE